MSLICGSAVGGASTEASVFSELGDIHNCLVLLATRRLYHSRM